MIFSSRAFSSGSTNRGPLRRGDVTRSKASATSAALSGSRSPITFVMPSHCGSSFRKRRSRRARSRSAMPASSAASRSSRAFAASRSAPTPSDSATSRRAMSVRVSTGMVSLGSPSPARIASADATPRSASRTASITGDSHGVALGSPAGGSLSSVPTCVSDRASRPVTPVTRWISSSGERAPCLTASPRIPSSRRDLRAISPATSASRASTRRRSAASVACSARSCIIVERRDGRSQDSQGHVSSTFGSWDRSPGTFESLFDSTKTRNSVGQLSTGGPPTSTQPAIGTFSAIAGSPPAGHISAPPVP